MVRFLRRFILILILAPLALTILYRFLPVPLTPLMLIRAVQGQGIAKDWSSRERISPYLARAIIAAEDNLFCRHSGFDWKAIEDAYDDWREGERGLRGASTISMQTAKNLFLWPGRDWLRKGLEAPLTVLIEAVLPKRRIMEIYMNIAEWGPGIYGAQAAARFHFQKSAAQLTPYEAAQLAAILPSPLRLWNKTQGGYVTRRTALIQGRLAQLGPLTDCIR